MQIGSFIQSTSVAKMNTSIVNILPQLKKIKRLSKSKQRKFIKSCHKDLLCCFANCARQLLKGRVKVRHDHLKKLSKHKRAVRLLALRKTSFKKRRQLLQTGGFLHLILPSVVSFLSSLISK